MDAIKAVTLIASEKTGKKYEEDLIRKCVQTTADKMSENYNNVSNSEVIAGILAVSQNEGSSGSSNNPKLITPETAVKYHLLQVLASEALFPIFDKYGTSRKTKQEYTEHKDSDSYFGYTFAYFGINAGKYTNFMDLCCNPGTFSLFMLKHNLYAKGIGLTLQPFKGGYKASPQLINHPRFKIIYRDLLEDDSLKFKVHNPIDFAYAGCFIKHNVGKEDSTRKLYANSYMIALSNMKKGGDFLNLMSFRWEYEFLLDTIALLLTCFENVRLYKSVEFTPGLSHVHLFCTNYKGSVDKDAFAKYVANEVKLYNYTILRRYADDINNVFKIMNDKHISLCK